ncbi:DUF6682 family protein [Xenophilus sp. Marseille-Q4582]|uniref:phage adaptor protein n=1 Tax=Xenophilus sp. Marseille-Q4582 TaxID=2866600 RepID=UPI001CE3C805|nr:DUF6682 family protein [Xenophilus sp. Marseille-Q4582]
MATPVSLVLRRAIDILQDTTSIRWPVPELVRWYNAALNEVMLHRPDAFNKSATMVCVAGTKQLLPEDGVKLIDVQRNSSGKAVRLCNREILDAQIPAWHSLPQKAEIVHFMYDEREPRSFWVYPPATSTASLIINYAAEPALATVPAEGAELSAVTGDIPCDDVYGNALTDYVLYRAYSKDAEYAGNAERAVAHYTVFANALGIELQRTVGVAPRSRNNPNAAAAQSQ